MPDVNFSTVILETHIVVNHIADGHIYRFQISPNNTVSLQGAQIERVAYFGQYQGAGYWPVSGPSGSSLNR
jgi:hypothetical protein